MKELYFLGTSLQDLRDFPESVRRDVGFDLRRVQSGLAPMNWKPMPSVGAGVREIRIRSEEGAFRVFYVVESETAVYVLHAFNKKTQKTPRVDIERGKERYKLIK